MIDALEQAGVTPNAVKQEKEAIRGILDESSNISARNGGHRPSDPESYDWSLFSDDSLSNSAEKNRSKYKESVPVVGENHTKAPSDDVAAQKHSSPEGTATTLDAERLLRETGFASWVDPCRGPDGRLSLPSLLALLANIGIAPARLSLPLARACFRSANASASAAAAVVQGSAALAGSGNAGITPGSSSETATDSLDSDGIIRCFGLLLPLAFPNTPGHPVSAAEDRTSGALEALARHFCGSASPPERPIPSQDEPYTRLSSVGTAVELARDSRSTDTTPSQDLLARSVSPLRTHQWSIRSLSSTLAPTAIDAVERDTEREALTARERALAEQYQAELDALASDCAAREAELQIRCQQV
jgi:hypothetical protein